jgi:hypothetical protein
MQTSRTIPSFDHETVSTSARRDRGRAVRHQYRSCFRMATRTSIKSRENCLPGNGADIWLMGCTTRRHFLSSYRERSRQALSGMVVDGDVDEFPIGSLIQEPVRRPVCGGRRC